MVDFLELPDVDHEGHFQALSDLADSLDRWVEKWAEEADTAAKSKPKHEHQVDAVISVYQHAGFVEIQVYGRLPGVGSLDNSDLAIVDGRRADSPLGKRLLDLCWKR